ncbi:hypothetical protein KAJ38_01330 [Candidatus Pacearchaeota archaeon]|nr:hypothetical protein [Candidatus Pacearchaeota archaeon]
MMELQNNNYRVVEENQIFIGRQGDLAKTSPLLECAGLLIYSNADRQGVLAHWQDKGIESSLCDILSQLKLKNPDAVIAGCGLPIECLIEDSQPYKEVRSFLEARKIPIREEKVGLDRQVELETNFSEGSYSLI